jgi:REP element-mobilizing transposase RayT
LKGWDYSSPGAYFVTIVTKYRTCYFGNVENGDMHLNELGEIAQQCFEKIPEHFPFVSLDSFVIMPNHVHGIIIIKHQPQQPETDTASYITAPKNKKMASISPKPSSLSVIIRSYKSAVSKQARQIHPDFVWQSRYYDHIIRDEKSLNNIRQYIIQNPLNWQADAENPVRNTNESVENAD